MKYTVSDIHCNETDSETWSCSDVFFHQGARGEIMIEQDSLKSWGEIPCGTSKRHNTELRAQKEDR